MRIVFTARNTRPAPTTTPNEAIFRGMCAKFWSLTSARYAVLAYPATIVAAVENVRRYSAFGRIRTHRKKYETIITTADRAGCSSRIAANIQTELRSMNGVPL